MITETRYEDLAKGWRIRMAIIGSFIAGLTVGQLALLAALILFYKQDRLQPHNREEQL